ncbi:hypothetical protein IX51_04000 [uncultured archaeon]|nr:hypothetical protein IX51_04000 [uncultured archaeon]HKJ97138.1 cytidine deaminase [Thermoplasmataceae archaeon]
MTVDYEIKKEDEELVEMAKKAIVDRYLENWHSIGAALRTKDGKIFTSVHIEASVGRIAVCAEAIAVAKALYDGSSQFDTIVAVKHPRPSNPDQSMKVVSPCGMCRELVSDYDRTAKVIYPDNGKLRKSDVLDLLPFKYK